MSVFRLEKTGLTFNFEQTAVPVNIIICYAEGLPNLGFCTKPMTDQIAEKEPEVLWVIFAMGVHRQTIDNILNMAILFITLTQELMNFVPLGKMGN